MTCLDRKLNQWSHPECKLVGSFKIDTAIKESLQNTIIQAENP